MFGIAVIVHFNGVACHLLPCSCVWAVVAPYLSTHSFNRRTLVWQAARTLLYGSLQTFCSVFSGIFKTISKQIILPVCVWFCFLLLPKKKKISHLNETLTIFSKCRCAHTDIFDICIYMYVYPRIKVQWQRDRMNISFGMRPCCNVDYRERLVGQLNVIFADKTALGSFSALPWPSCCPSAGACYLLDSGNTILCGMLRVWGP